MPWFDIVGWISGFFLLVSAYGLWLQLRMIWKRRLDFAGRPGFTEVLSLNHFLVRFTAFLSILVLGFAREPFNPYLVYPYLPVVLLLLLIVREIFVDRRDFTSTVGIAYCSAAVIAAAAVAVSGNRAADHMATHVAEGILVAAAFLIAQSDAHQIWLIRRRGDTGAVAMRTHQTTVIKDLSAVALGLVMGFASGWPLILSAGTSAVGKSLVLWHFRWSRMSDTARERREAVVVEK